MCDNEPEPQEIDRSPVQWTKPNAFEEALGEFRFASHQGTQAEEETARQRLRQLYDDGKKQSWEDGMVAYTDVAYTEDEVREMLIKMGSRTLKLIHERGCYALSIRHVELADRILAEAEGEKR